MQNVNNTLVLTSLSIPELKNIFRSEIEAYFNSNPLPPSDLSEDNIVIKIDEAAKFIGLSVPSVYRLVNQRKLPAIQKGKKLLFLKKELNAWLLTGRKLTLSEIQRRSAEIEKVT